MKTIVRASTTAQTGTSPITGAGYVGIAGLGTGNETTVIAIAWGWMLLIRISRMYLQTFFGLWAADATGYIDINIPEAAWGRMGIVAYAALAPTVFSLGQNLLEYLTKLDVRAPVLRG